MAAVRDSPSSNGLSSGTSVISTLNAPTVRFSMASKSGSPPHAIAITGINPRIDAASLIFRTDNGEVTCGADKWKLGNSFGVPEVPGDYRDRWFVIESDI